MRLLRWLATCVAGWKLTLDGAPLNSAVGTSILLRGRRRRCKHEHVVSHLMEHEPDWYVKMKATGIYDWVPKPLRYARDTCADCGVELWSLEDQLRTEALERSAREISPLGWKRHE